MKIDLTDAQMDVIDVCLRTAYRRLDFLGEKDEGMRDSAAVVRDVLFAIQEQRRADEQRDC